MCIHILDNQCFRVCYLYTINCKKNIGYFEPRWLFQLRVAMLAYTVQEMLAIYCTFQIVNTLIS